jgi:hypothetical protein
MTRKLRALRAIEFLAGVGLLPPAAAFADPPGIPPLTPRAPPYYTYQATGAGPICRGEQHFVDRRPRPPASSVARRHNRSSC